MWRSDKDRTAKLLPPSSNLLAHAKSDRAVQKSYFRELTSKWTAVVRKPLEVEATDTPVEATTELPVYLRHRPAGKSRKLFFKTNVVARTKR